MAEPETQLRAAAFERKDIGEGFIWGVVGICVAVLVGCALLVAWLYPQAVTDRVIAAPLPVYPQPRLQADPVADLQRFRARELKALNDSGIDTAMQQVATAGIPDWPPP